MIWFGKLDSQRRRSPKTLENERPIFKGMNIKKLKIKFSDFFNIR